MAKIFISYSRVDKKIVEEFVRDLRADNHDIWFDQNVTGGQNWWDNILSQIKACEIFVAALSPEYVESRPCQSEREYAKDLERILLPVRLSDKVSPNSLPPDLIGVHWVDYSRLDRQGLLDLQAALRNLPKAPRLPKPLPAAPSIPINLREPIPKPAVIEQAIASPKPQLPPTTPEKPKGPAIGEFSGHKYGRASASALLQGAILLQGFSIFWRYKCMTTVSYHNTPNNCFYIPFLMSSFAALAVVGLIPGIIRDLEARKINFKSIIIEAILTVFFICTAFYSIYQFTTHGTWPY